jgi:hypothetical protein
MRTGDQQVWKMPAEGGPAVQVTRDGGFAPVESPDGMFIYYTQFLYGTRLGRIPIKGGPPTKVLEPLEGDTRI